jgi:hypothetical protein
MTKGKELILGAQEDALRKNRGDFFGFGFG